MSTSMAIDTPPPSSTTYTDPTPSGTAATQSNGNGNGISAPSTSTSSEPQPPPPSTSNGTPSAPVAPTPTAAPPPPLPLEEREFSLFGTSAELDILPAPPRDPNAASSLGTSDQSGSAGDTPANGGGSKRSLGTGGGPLARAKRGPKNVKFSPAKVGKQLARRSAAAATASAAVGSGLGAGGEVILANNDFCDSCGGKGHFLCCEGGCLRSFHFGCLEPPLEIDEVPEESWFCKACRAKANPPPKYAPGFFSDLIYNVEKENPKAFQLSTDLKQFYKNVAVGLNGEFIDSNEHRPPSKITGRAVGQEDRDGYRLKDKNGRPIICYNCSQAANPHLHRRIISCDFCDQHWHLDCLNPPMTGMPPPTRKWMCPVHSEHVLPKKRVPRQTTVVNIEERGIPNNGDIIVQPPPERAPPEEYEEMTVNRIRYQVPEQNIILDFWGKLSSSTSSSRKTTAGGTKSRERKRVSPKKKRRTNSSSNGNGNGNGYESGNSSPLTDLTSSEDEDRDGDIEMRQRPRSKSINRASTTPAPSSTNANATPTNLLDNLALLAEVRYIDLLNGNKDSTSAPPSSSSTAANSRFPVPSIPPFTSPSSSSLPLAPSTSAQNRTSPSLSPAPVAIAARGTSATPQSQAELTVQSKEDLKALMQVRKLLLSQGQGQGQGSGNGKTTMLSFLEGAPIIPKLAFVNNSKSSTSWQRPWEGGKKDAPPSRSNAQPGTPSAAPVSPAPPASTPLPSETAPKFSTTNEPSIKLEADRSSSSVPSKPSEPLPSTVSPAAPPKLPLPPSTRPPSHSSVLSASSHLVPTPYSSDMPFQLPAFRPPTATPTTSVTPQSQSEGGLKGPGGSEGMK
ncbi:Rco1p [Sporobolomyces salmoneus]|uniref:Rco1p n=1 Tax=Sporobolomyces salmoneus TaxID=183962 RepID=UPI0031788345